MTPIRTEADYEAALARIEQLWDAPLGSPEGDELDILVDLVELYELKYVPMDYPSPAAAIEFRLDQEGLTPDDLAPDVGTPTEIADLLSGRREVTLAVAQALHSRLGIPYDVLLQEPSKAAMAARPSPQTSHRSRRSEATGPCISPSGERHV